MLKLKTTAIYRQKTQHFVGLWHSHWNDISIYFNGNVISMWFLDNHRCLGSMEDWCHQDHGSFLCVPPKQFRKIEIVAIKPAFVFLAFKYDTLAVSYHERWKVEVFAKIPLIFALEHPPGYHCFILFQRVASREHIQNTRHFVVFLFK